MRTPRTYTRRGAPRDADGLEPGERALVDEEEALLARVLVSLAAREPRARRQDTADLLVRLREFREEAVGSTTKDLPTVFQEMGLVRALLERPRQEGVPDPAAPYFAHLRVREGAVARDYCLGRATFVDRDSGVRVVDWRYAPIAALFYRYREGEAFEEELPGRVLHGVVEARRVVVVERGVLTRIATPSVTLARGRDGRWTAARGSAARLGGGEGTAARAGILGVGAGAEGRGAAAEITALLDPEQFEALSVPADEPLLVLGSAGSGKTTVALHRLARLAFDDPRRFAPGRLAVIVPEPGLARLTARLLEPLGLGKVAVRTLDSWARGAFQSAFGAPPPRLCEDTPPLVARLKRHPALYAALRRRPHVAQPPRLGPLRRETAELFTDRAFLEAVVRASDGGLPTTAIDEVVRHTRLQIAPPPDDEVRGVDPERREALDGLSLSAGTPEAIAGTLDVEDVAVLLFLAAWRGGGGPRSVSHLVVDEAEDMSLFELFVLGKLLGGHRSVTIAGDEGQQTFSSYAGWPEALGALGASDATTCRLEVTYRCPGPIAAFAQAVLGPLALPAPPRAGRPGVPVGRFDFPAEAHAHLFLVEALRDLLEREPQASVAVIAAAPDTARAIHRLIADLPEARLVLDGAFAFRPGLDVTDVSTVKGLEFDYVVVPDASAAAYPESDEARRRLHVAVTRASHQLWVVAPGTPSPLIRSLAAS
jgi:DNA helicase-2/ATP-dependent DNA helicase PcrA